MNAWPVHTFETWTDFQEGQVLLIDKPREWTSFDVVNKVRYAIRKGGGFRKIKVEIEEANSEKAARCGKT